jgi:ABC-type nickel/cobalt efflux system permease component RcnA
MFLSLYLGLLHAMEPDHVAVVTGVSLEGDRARAWKVGLAFGLSHMLAVALLSALALLLGHEAFGDGFYRWMDRGAWIIVALLGVWNLAAALGLREIRVHTHRHSHGALEHEHPHEGNSHRFHHSAAWLGAFFGLGGIKGFTTLMQHGGVHGTLSFALALLCFGVGITGMFVLLSLASGWLAARLGSHGRFRRLLYGASGVGNLAVGIWLLLRG